MMMVLFVYKERILEGCVPPACQPYVFHWPPLGVSTVQDGGGVGPHVIKFEQVSSDDHHLSVEGVGPMSGI